MISFMLFFSLISPVRAEGSADYGFIVTEEEKQAKEKLDQAEKDLAAASQAEQAAKEDLDAKEKTLKDAEDKVQEAQKAVDEAYRQPKMHWQKEKTVRMKH